LNFNFSIVLPSLKLDLSSPLRDNTPVEHHAEAALDAIESLHKAAQNQHLHQFDYPEFERRLRKSVNTTPHHTTPHHTTPQHHAHTSVG